MCAPIGRPANVGGAFRQKIARRASDQWHQLQPRTHIAAADRDLRTVAGKPYAS